MLAKGRKEKKKGEGEDRKIIGKMPEEMDTIY